MCGCMFHRNMCITLKIQIIYYTQNYISLRSRLVEGWQLCLPCKACETASRRLFACFCWFVSYVCVTLCLCGSSVFFSLCVCWFFWLYLCFCHVLVFSVLLGWVFSFLLYVFSLLFVYVFLLKTYSVVFVFVLQENFIISK